ncbi:MAG: hypothetical protein RMK57_11960 [Bryobacterales bacterium]|nr:hypothetical protein [Bryobacteraceae bacterium]MDW8355235.1 hypothetical protein [Bryobacterales bacterium]
MRHWVACCLLSSLAYAELRVGAAAVKITPPVGLPLAGYYHVRLATGMHDELYAKALVLEGSGSRAALVACDLIALEGDLVEAARQLIERTTGLRGDRVMISATHTHTGPEVERQFLAFVEGAPRQAAERYRAELPSRIAEAVRLAEAALTPARAWAHIGREETLAFYRRFRMKDGTVQFNPGKLNPDIVEPVGKPDPDVAVVYFDTPDDKPLATYVNYALHLDTVGGTEYSGDYPYTLARLLGQVKGPGMLTLFTLAAAGNINHVDVKSPEPQKGHGEAQRIGTVLAGEVLKSYARLKPVVSGPVRVLSRRLELPARQVEPGALESARDTARWFGKPGGPPFLDMVAALRTLDLAGRGGKAIPAEVQVVALGEEVAWVGLPGEIFVELGVAIKRASPFPRTVVVSLANGSIDYVPTKEAFAEGAYEVISARCAPGCGEMLADAAIGLLRDLYKR